VTAPTPGTPATAQSTWWTRSDEWQEALRGALHGLGIYAEDHGHSEYFVLDALLDALVAPVAAREAAAYARGRAEGRAEGVARAPGGIWPSAARGAVLDALHRVDHPTLPRLATAAIMALTPFYRMALDEAWDDEALRERMASLLRGTANALKGDPGPLAAHDWSDLPRVAAALRAEVVVAEQRGAAKALRAAVVELQGAARDADTADEAQMFRRCADWLTRAATVADPDTTGTARACCCHADPCPCGMPGMAPTHVHRCVYAALDVGHCDDTCTSPCPARPDTTHEGDPS
jgi:hypothetical protein